MNIVVPPTHAVNSFSQNGSVFFDNYPLHKFNFAVVLNVNPVSGLEFDVERTVLIVKNVNIGGWSIDTDVANEYNRQRIVHKRLNFHDTVITMHDVADGKGLRLAEKYYRYYFGDGRDVAQFGYDTALIPDTNRRYIFDSIDIYQFQARKANRTRLYYPKLIDFSQDTANYAEISGLMELSFTFKPEYIKYDRNIALPGEVLNQMALGGTPTQLSRSVETFIEPETRVELDDLRQQALNQLSSNVTSSSPNRQTVVDQYNGTAFTERSVEALVSGSKSTGTSNSSLDAFGRLTSDLRRKLPNGLQKSSNKNFDIVPSTVQKTDGTDNFIDPDNRGRF